MFHRSSRGIFYIPYAGQSPFKHNLAPSTEISACLIPPAAMQTPVHSSNGPVLAAISSQQSLTHCPKLPHIPNPVKTKKPQRGTQTSAHRLLPNPAPALISGILTSWANILGPAHEANTPQQDPVLQAAIAKYTMLPETSVTSVAISCLFGDIRGKFPLCLSALVAVLIRANPRNPRLREN